MLCSHVVSRGHIILHSQLALQSPYRSVPKGLPMSVIIVFPDGTDWFKANWVFRQLAQDVSDRYSSDAEVCTVVEVAEALSALDLKKMNDGLRRRVMKALTTVA